MPKDYAKRNFNNVRTPKKRWRIEFILAPVLIVLCALGYWIYAEKTQVLAEEQKMVSFYSKIKMLFANKPVVITTKVKVAAVPNQQPEVHFDFYTQLPTMQVSAPIVAETKEQVRGPQYIVQLGEFKSAEAAAELRVSLLLSGCEADVVVVKLSAGNVYRVQRGPFANMAEAERLQRQLEKKGIEGAIKAG